MSTTQRQAVVLPQPIAEGFAGKKDGEYVEVEEEEEENALSEANELRPRRRLGMAGRIRFGSRQSGGRPVYHPAKAPNAKSSGRTG